MKTKIWWRAWDNENKSLINIAYWLLLHSFCHEQFSQLETKKCNCKFPCLGGRVLQTKIEYVFCAISKLSAFSGKWYMHPKIVRETQKWHHNFSRPSGFCFVLFLFLFCFVLFCFVLFCFVLFCFVLFCFVLFCFVLFCFVLLFVCLIFVFVFCFVFVFVCLFVFLFFVLFCFLIKWLIKTSKILFWSKTKNRSAYQNLNVIYEFLRQ